MNKQEIIKIIMDELKPSEQASKFVEVIVENTLNVLESKEIIHYGHEKKNELGNCQYREWGKEHKRLKDKYENGLDEVSNTLDKLSNVLKKI